MFVTVNLQDLGSWPSDPAALYSYNPPSITNISLLSNTTTDTMGSIYLRNCKSPPTVLIVSMLAIQ